MPSREYVYDVAVDNLAISQVAVAATATALVSARPNRLFVIVTNGSDAPVYFGTANTVTTSNGALIPSGATRVIQYTGAMWVITATGPKTVTVEDYYV